MQKKSLTKLLHDLEQEMLRDGYTEGTMNFTTGDGKCYFNSHRNKGRPIILNKDQALFSWFSELK